MNPEPRRAGPTALIGEDEILVMVEEAIAAARAAPVAANDGDEMALEELLEPCR